ncbi:MAG: hypothetical protein RR253_04125, partial [Oscillospiraceae bacterium]
MLHSGVACCKHIAYVFHLKLRFDFVDVSVQFAHKRKLHSPQFSALARFYSADYVCAKHRLRI